MPAEEVVHTASQGHTIDGTGLWEGAGQVSGEVVAALCVVVASTLVFLLRAAMRRGRAGAAMARRTASRRTLLSSSDTADGAPRSPTSAAGAAAVGSPGEAGERGAPATSPTSTGASASPAHAASPRGGGGLSASAGAGGGGGEELAQRQAAAAHQSFLTEHQRRCDAVAAALPALAKQQYELQELVRKVGADGDSFEARAAIRKLVSSGEAAANDGVDLLCDHILGIVSMGMGSASASSDPRLAAAREYTQVLRALISQANNLHQTIGALHEAERRDTTGMTAHAREEFRRAEEARMKREAEIRAKAEADAKALLRACSAGATDAVVELLRGGANIACVDTSGHTPLHIAAEMNHGSLARVLLRHGAPSAALDAKGYAPLHVAVIAGSRGCAEAILQTDVTVVDTKTRDGRTALMLAAQAANADVAELLLRSGADAEVDFVAADGTRQRAVHFAAANGAVAVMATLVRYGVSVTGANSCDDLAEDASPAPIDIARSRVDEEMITLLEWELDRPAREAAEKAEREAAQRRAEMEQAFIAAVVSGDVADVRSMLNPRERRSTEVVSVDCTDDAGLTPLHMACFFGHVELVEVLLAAGASLKLHAENGKTPMDVARQMGRGNIVRMLRAESRSRKASKTSGSDSERQRTGSMASRESAASTASPTRSDATGGEAAESAAGGAGGAGSARKSAPRAPTRAPGEFDPADFSGVWTVDETSESLAPILVELGINWVGRKLILSIEVVSTITMDDRHINISDMTKFGGTDTTVKLNEPGAPWTVIRGEKGDVEMRGSLDDDVLTLETRLDKGQGVTTDTRRMEGRNRMSQKLELRKDGVLKATVNRTFVRDTSVAQPATKAELNERLRAEEEAAAEVDDDADDAAGAAAAAESDGSDGEAKDDGGAAATAIVRVLLPSGTEIDCSPEEAAKITAATAATVVGGDDSALQLLEELVARHDVPGTGGRASFSVRGELFCDGVELTALLRLPKARVVSADPDDVWAVAADGRARGLAGEFASYPCGVILKGSCHIFYASADGGHVHHLVEQGSGSASAVGWSGRNLSDGSVTDRVSAHGGLSVLAEAGRLHVYFITAARHIEELLFWNKWSLVSPYEIAKSDGPLPPAAQVLETFNTATTLGLYFVGQDGVRYQMRYALFKGWRVTAVET